jgi:hypothetical protein
MPNQTSQLLQNRDSVATTLNNSNNGSRGALQATYGHVSVTTGEVSTNILRLLEVPSNARLSQTRLYSTALGGTAAGNIGFYRNIRDGGAIVGSGNQLGSAVSLVSAVNGAEQVGTLTPVLRAQPLWQALGFAADPRTTFDLAITLTANVASAGSVGAEATYAQ